MFAMCARKSVSDCVKRREEETWPAWEEIHEVSGLMSGTMAGASMKH